MKKEKTKEQLAAESFVQDFIHSHRPSRSNGGALELDFDIKQMESLFEAEEKIKKMLTRAMKKIDGEI